jgi:hypothetical protein
VVDPSPRKLNVQLAEALEVKYLAPEVTISTSTVPVAAVAETVIVSVGESRFGRTNGAAVRGAYVLDAVPVFK